MREATSTITPGALRPPLMFERYDLERHPDADLLRLCSTLARMRGQLEALERAIEAIPAVTVEGRRMKECTL